MTAFDMMQVIQRACVQNSNMAEVGPARHWHVRPACGETERVGEAQTGRHDTTVT